MPTVTGRATDFITFSRASNATVVASDGKIKWAGHNLVLNSAAPVTQNVTVIAGATYTVEMTGSGSVALSDAGTGTASSGTPATITATTTTLTLTCSGTVSTMWAYRSDLGGMVANPATGTSYYPTTSAAYYAPRLDYDPVTLAARGLLVEEARTNLLTYSEAFDNAAWTKTNVTVAANTTASPDGTVDAETITASTASACRATQTVTIANATAAVLSCYLRAGSGNGALSYSNGGGLNVCYAKFDLSAGTVSGTASATATITPVGNGWYRCAMAFTTGVANGVPAVHVWDGAADIFNYPATASGKSVIAWGAQLEAGSFATSYIPTIAASATRSADVASVATSAFPYSSTASTLVAAFSTLGQSAGNTLVQLAASAAANGLRLYQSSGSLQMNAYVDGSFVSLGNATANTIQKIGLAYNGASNGAVRNGGAVSSVGTTVSAPANKLGIGSSFDNSAVMNGHIRQITYIPRRLTDAELQARTA